MADTAFQQRRNRVLGVTSTSSASAPVGSSYFQERRKQVLEQSVQPKTQTPQNVVQITPTQKKIDLKSIGSQVFNKVKEEPSLIVKGLKLAFKTASDPNKVVSQIKEALPKEQKQPQVKQEPRQPSLIDSFKKVTDKTAFKAVKQSVKPYVDAYDLVSGFLGQQEAVGVQRFGKELPRDPNGPFLQQTKTGPAQPDYKYEPKNQAQAIGKLIYNLGEEFVVWQNSGLNTSVESGLGVIGQSIKASPTVAPKLAFVEQVVSTFASKKWNQFLNKVKPLKITLQDLKDVTNGKGTPEQLLKFDKFNKLRESGMPVNEILKAGEKEPLKTRVYDFIKKVTDEVSSTLKKSVTPEERKLLTSGLKKDIEQVVGVGEQTPEEVVGKIINAGLDTTTEGKQVIKMALEAENTGQNIVISNVLPEKPDVRLPTKVDKRPLDQQKLEVSNNIKEAKTTIKKVQERYENLINEAQAKASIAEEKRYGINTDKVAQLKRIYANTKSFREGDIETIRSSKHSDLLNSVIENIQEINPSFTEQEAFDYALELPTKADEKFVKGAEIKDLEKKQKILDEYIDNLKSKEKELDFKQDTEFYKEWQSALAMQEKLKKIIQVRRNQIPIGEGKIKASRLEARMKGVLDKATQEDIEKLGLTTYRQMNEKETLERASEYVTNNFDDAIKVLTGEIQSPKGLNQGAIYTAIANSDLDEEALRKISSVNFTAMGQNIGILKNINKDSPVSVLQDIIEIREQELERRTGKKVKDLIEKEVSKIKAEVKPPTKTDWSKFLDEIECK